MAHEEAVVPNIERLCVAMTVRELVLQNCKDLLQCAGGTCMNWFLELQRKMKFHRPQKDLHYWSILLMQQSVMSAHRSLYVLGKDLLTAVCTALIQMAQCGREDQSVELLEERALVSVNWSVFTAFASASLRMLPKWLRRSIWTKQQP